MMKFSPFPRNTESAQSLAKKNRHEPKMNMIPFSQRRVTNPSSFLFGGYEDRPMVRRNVIIPEPVVAPKTDFQVTWHPNEQIDVSKKRVMTVKDETDVHLYALGLFIITAYSTDGNMFFFAMTVNRSDEKDVSPIMVSPPSGQHFKTAFVFSNKNTEFPWSIRLTPESSFKDTPYTCQTIHVT